MTLEEAQTIIEAAGISKGILAKINLTVLVELDNETDRKLNDYDLSVLTAAAYFVSCVTMHEVVKCLREMEDPPIPNS